MFRPIPTKLFEFQIFKSWILNSLMRPDRHNPEIVEPSFGLIGAVADHKMVAVQRLITHLELPPNIGKSLDGVANHQGTLFACDAYCAVAEIFMELNPKRVMFQEGLNVRAAHVAIGHRAFDVDFVFVVIVNLVSFRARNQHTANCH